MVRRRRGRRRHRRRLRRWSQRRRRWRRRQQLRAGLHAVPQRHPRRQRTRDHHLGPARPPDDDRDPLVREPVRVRRPRPLHGRGVAGGLPRLPRDGHRAVRGRRRAARRPGDPVARACRLGGRPAARERPPHGPRRLSPHRSLHGQHEHVHAGCRRGAVRDDRDIVVAAHELRRARPFHRDGRAAKRDRQRAVRSRRVGPRRSRDARQRLGDLTGDLRASRPARVTPSPRSTGATPPCRRAPGR